MPRLIEDVGNKVLLDQYAFVHVLSCSGTPRFSSQRNELSETVCDPHVHRTCQSVTLYMSEYLKDKVYESNPYSLRLTEEEHSKRYRGADKSLARPTSRCILFEGENVSFDASLVICMYIYTGCPRRNVPDFGRVFLMLKYTDITQNTYVQI